MKDFQKLTKVLKKSSMNNFFFVIWGNPKFYQTLIFLARHLSKKGKKILIICKESNLQNNIIEKIDFGKNTSVLTLPNPFFSSFNFLNYFFFVMYVIYKHFRINPRNVVFFNQKSLFIVILINIFSKKKNQKFYYHNFDFDLKKNLLEFKDKLLFKIEIYASKFCDSLIFPSQRRSEIFANIAKNKSKNLYYCMNCFPLNYTPKTDFRFRSFLKNKKLLKKKIICRLGSIGPNHFIEKIIQSSKFTNQNVIYIFAGVSINNYANKLQNKIRKLNLSNKIFIFENIKNKFWFDILYNSDLGICLYKNTNLSHMNMAGTSQKFNNYLLANIPMITNDNLDFRKFKKKFDIYEIANPNSPKDIAKKINHILKNKKRRNIIKKNMLKAYKQELNFEYQFRISYGKFLP